MPARRVLTEADHVWNRACHRTGDNLHEGDRALGASLIVHGYLVNGGVAHAALDISAGELAAGIAGYIFFGLDELASIIQRFVAAADDARGDGDARYFRVAGPAIREHFNAIFASRPYEFYAVGRA
jgi:hypothetical protein